MDGRGDVGGGEYQEPRHDHHRAQLTPRDSGALKRREAALGQQEAGGEGAALDLPDDVHGRTEGPEAGVGEGGEGGQADVSGGRGGTREGDLRGGDDLLQPVGPGQLLHSRDLVIPAEGRVVEAAEELLPLEEGGGEEPQGVKPALEEGEGGAPGERLGAALDRLQVSPCQCSSLLLAFDLLEVVEFEVVGDGIPSQVVAKPEHLAPQRLCGRRVLVSGDGQELGRHAAQGQDPGHGAGVAPVLKGLALHPGHLVPVAAQDAVVHIGLLQDLLGCLDVQLHAQLRRPPLHELQQQPGGEVAEGGAGVGAHPPGQAGRLPPEEAPHVQLLLPGVDHVVGLLDVGDEGDLDGAPVDEHAQEVRQGVRAGPDAVVEGQP